MNDQLSAETECLRRSWDRHPQEMLRDYMVAGIHDPRVNPQSIRSRHFLIEALFGPKYRKLCEEEFRFAAVMQWLMKQAGKFCGGEDWGDLQHALNCGADNLEGLPIPHYITAASKLLPLTADGVGIPDYLSAAVEAARRRETPTAGLGDAADVFAKLWDEQLAKVQSTKITVVEAACGSANDYRAIKQCGLARHLDYLGFDLCEKNVSNARALLPEARFEVGNVFSIGARDLSFDCAFAHDLLEHFSVEGMERAVAELCRVARRGVFVGFFQMHEGGHHVIRAVEEYHWNTLSLPRVRELFEQRGFQTQAICVDLWWRYWLNTPAALYYDTAYDLVAWRR